MDSVGGVITEQSLGCLAKFGRLVVFGNSSGSYAEMQTKDLHASCRQVIGFSLGTTRKERPELLKETASHVFKLIEEGKLEVHISKKLSLEDAPLAHELVESRNSTGKILLYVHKS
ncbi:hypothetical protein L3i20_v207770 [Paenibacillus sp. L3-i20]|nr:hypothetical protein L3i20_v207770 [Paenibacillus sp. L3-i20]